jgi:hypothetical protein
VEWLALPTVSAWAGATVYPAGRYVTKGGELYLCTIGGTSGGTGPVATATDSTETDGTVTWKNIGVASWAGQKSFNENDHILISSQYYKCVSSGKTGGTQPTWTLTTMSDGTITWTEDTEAYDALLADTDLCHFDDTLMISGMTWRFLRTQGLGYQDLLNEYSVKKEAAVNRYMPNQSFSLAESDEPQTIYLRNIGQTS